MVVMIGDGVNDVLVLKVVDVGIVMGIMGIEVFKEVVDMVLMDDNFVMIMVVVKEGWIVYQNIIKVVEFLVGVNFV